MNLNDRNISYIIISAYSINNSQQDNFVLNDKLEDALYLKEYSLNKLGGVYNGMREESFLAFKKAENDELRKDAIELMDRFNQKSVIVKYKGDPTPKKILKDGNEKPLGIAMYSDNLDNRSYFNGGVSFSFVEQKRYFTPTKKEDFKDGMIIEIKNNKDKWVETKVQNRDFEWEKVYKLFTKYDKVRIPLD